MGRLAQTEGLTESELDILATVREFTDREIIPVAGDLDHAERILDAYDWSTSRAGGAKGSAMLGDEMIDEASRKMALVVAAKGRAAGMSRTSAFEPPQE